MVDTGIALLLIPLLPLVSGLLARMFCARLPLVSAALGIASLLGSLAVAAQLLIVQIADPMRVAAAQMEWITLSAAQTIPLALQAGIAQLLFIVTAALLAAGVLLYALRERRDDPRAGVFHAHITMFAGSMLLLLCADTLLLVYLAWELLGLFSLLLIAHSGTAEALRSARQAFWTTRATDMGLLFAILIMLVIFRWPTLSSVNITTMLQELVARSGPDALAAITGAFGMIGLVILLVLAAVIGKSAQWPLSFWLADAMVAPAPVSALLHAATLVAAGPYMLFMLRPLLLPRMLMGNDNSAAFFAPELALLAVCLLGALTMLLGGLMALFAGDPKRVLAYSTVSQLGLCICGMGLLAERAAFFHLLAHAWSKAALFLAVGALAAWWHARQQQHGHAAPQLPDLAGAARRSPLLLAAMCLAAASLAGLPLLGGAFGKEQLLWAAWARAATMPDGFPETLGAAFPLAALGWQISAVLLVLSLPVTAAYLTRLVAILGWGAPRPAGSAAVDEPAASAAPRGWGSGLGVMLVFALLGSIGLGLLAHPYERLFRSAESAYQWIPQDGTALLVLGGSLLLALLGGVFGVLLARPAIERRVAAMPLAGYFERGMLLREFWHRLVADGGMWLAALAGRAEQNLFQLGAERTGRFGRTLARAAAWLDRHLIDGIRWQACELWWRLKRLHNRWLQNGDIQHYMLIILLGAVVLCIVVIRPLSHIFARVLERF